MIAASTGISPMYQICSHALKDPAEDQTQIVLVYANRDEKDILLKKKLDSWASTHSHRFMVHYVLSKPTVHWPPDMKGHVTKDIIQRAVQTTSPQAQDNITDISYNDMYLMCGPSGFVECVQSILKELKCNLIHTFLIYGHLFRLTRNLYFQNCFAGEVRISLC